MSNSNQTFQTKHFLLLSINNQTGVEFHNLKVCKTFLYPIHVVIISVSTWTVQAMPQ